LDITSTNKLLSRNCSTSAALIAVNHAHCHPLHHWAMQEIQFCVVVLHICGLCMEVASLTTWVPTILLRFMGSWKI
jgi:tRNA A37 threonylcarbamoyltransferase TsaD